MTQQENLTSGQNGARAILVQIAPVGFGDPNAAARSIDRMLVEPGAGGAAAELFPVFAPHLFNALASAGGPDRVLATFERFLHSAADPLSIYRFLAAHPRQVEMPEAWRALCS